MQSTGLRDVYMYDWVSGRGRMGLDGGCVGREQDILRKNFGQICRGWEKKSREKKKKKSRVAGRKMYSLASINLKNI